MALLKIQLNPINQRRLRNFRNNRRGFVSLWIFLILFVATLFAEFVANDKPLLIVYESELYLPIFTVYPETTFGGEFETETDYRVTYVKDLIDGILGTQQ